MSQLIPTADISAVERETGISKDTLRVWERRYGFPKPLRGPNGARTYPLDQLARLHTIRRLLDQGVRPGVLLRSHAATPAVGEMDRASPDKRDAETPGRIVALGNLLTERRLPALQSELSMTLMQWGVQRFVAEVAGPLTATVGELWQAGRIGIADEHRYTELLQQLLRSVVRTDFVTHRKPRILLTTLSGEPHALGLLMVHAWLAAENIECVSLGTQTPATEVAAAARAYEVDIVGVSFSALRPVHVARRDLLALRSMLVPSIALWAGGSVWRSARKRVPGAEFVPDFDTLASALKSWS